MKLLVPILSEPDQVPIKFQVLDLKLLVPTQQFEYPINTSLN